MYVIFKTSLIAIFLMLVMGNRQILAQYKCFPVDTLTLVIDGEYPPFDQVMPGDTLQFEPGNRKYLIFRNIFGELNQPVIISNRSGKVVIDTDHYFGISFRNCRYFRLTGTGDQNHFYGFNIKRVQSGGGIGVGDGSSDFELDHISIENCQGSGINAKTDPDCSFDHTREKFTQFNTFIHDNYISNVSFEGMYIGSTKYFGQTISCNGQDTLLMPSLLNGIRIYNNIIRNTGWDGIQVSSASFNCNIFNNVITYDSQEEVFGQMSGIMIGGGSDCDCYNNFISEGKGTGIESHGLGGYRIFNNIIKNAGINHQTGNENSRKYGMYISNTSMLSDSSIQVTHNTIINPKSDGIRFTSIPGTQNSATNNVIVNPGNFWEYENDQTNYNGIDAYIMLQDPEIQVNIRNNYYTLDINDAGFAGEDFTLAAGSPLIDAGYTAIPPVIFDFYGEQRPHGVASDIGAFEFNQDNLSTFPKEMNEDTGAFAFPVLSRDITTLCFPSRKPGHAHLYIFSVNGRLFSEFEINTVQVGLNSKTVDVQSYKSGIYLYKIILEDGTEFTGKFIKVK
jgi:hypothetical protein